MGEGGVQTAAHVCLRGCKHICAVCKKQKSGGGVKVFFFQSQIVWGVKWCSSWDSYRSEHPGFSESARLGKT